MILLEKNIQSKNNLVHDYFNKTTALIEVSEKASDIYEGDLQVFQANRTNKKKGKTEGIFTQVMQNKTHKKGKKLDPPQKYYN